MVPDRIFYILDKSYNSLHYCVVYGIYKFTTEYCHVSDFLSLPLYSKITVISIAKFRFCHAISTQIRCQHSAYIIGIIYNNIFPTKAPNSAEVNSYHHTSKGGNMRLQRNEYNSVCYEIGASTKFPSVFLSKKPSAHSRILQLTKDFRIQDTQVVFFDANGPFLHHEYFSPFDTTHVFHMRSNIPMLLGATKKQLPIKQLCMLLLTTDIIGTYLFMESEVFITKVSENIARIHGDFVVCRSTGKRQEFGLTLEYTDHGHILLCKHDLI